MMTEFAHHCPEELFIALIKIIGFLHYCGADEPAAGADYLRGTAGDGVLFQHISTKRMRASFQALQRHQLGRIERPGGGQPVRAYGWSNPSPTRKLKKRKFAQGNLRFLDIKKTMYRVHGRVPFRQPGCLTALMYIIVVVVGALCS